ncbi:MAG: YigZ family protein [Bacteroidales bacterium]|nr:YigZ family protein [Bacteroidales bacterium]
MLSEDTYITISGRSEGTYRDRGSRFIGIAVPVSSGEEVKERLEAIKKQYHDATHHCYAYRLGPMGMVFRYHDDGEPSGTAGRPIYGQICALGLTNIMVVVVRYFGGIKLGTGGLIRAYKTAARETLAQVQSVTKTVQDVYRVFFDYSKTGDVNRIIRELSAQQLDQKFNHRCVLVIAVKKGLSGKFTQRMGLLDGVELEFLRSV